MKLHGYTQIIIVITWIQVVFIETFTCAKHHSSLKVKRQIRPLACSDKLNIQHGVCTFMLDCSMRGGNHLGVCMDRFFIGSCCQLPSFENELVSTSTKPPWKPQELTTNAIMTTTRPPFYPKTTTQVPETTSQINELTTSKPGKLSNSFFTENGTLLNNNATQICGRRLYERYRIVGGQEATYAKWPWQVSIRAWRNGAETFIHLCGGALINRNWAITAAHCVEKVLTEDIRIRLGEFDLAEETVPFNYTERRVHLKVLYPKFSGSRHSFEYDLALLRFYEPITYQPNIIPICLPQPDGSDFEGKIAYATGWGRLYNGGPVPAKMHEVRVPILTNKECEMMFSKAGFNEKIPDVFMCAAWPNGQKDACEGDSGGPLVLQDSKQDRWLLAGVISWGIGCAELNQPGVYTRITKFVHWVKSVTDF